MFTRDRERVEMRFLFVFAALTAAPAWANCPTGTDLATGIRIIEDDGTRQVYRSTQNGVVQLDIRSSKNTFRNLLAQGTHLLQLSELEDGRVIPGSIVNTSYPAAPESLPVPTPSSQWTVETIVRGYGDIYAEIQTQTWGRLIEYTIGSCSYDVIPGKVRYASDGFTIDEGIYYFPELGIGLLHLIDDSESAPETYTFVQSEAVR